ncbi:MAG: ABC-F family ATP-binding cassette domain-containing protein [Spongiibacteraceae bacterium]
MQARQTAALAVQHLYYQLNNGNYLFRDLNVILPNHIQGLTGRNGAGKSVLAELLIGQRQPHTGQIQRYCSIGLLPQALPPSSTQTIADYLSVNVALKALKRIERGSNDAKDFERAGDNWLIREALCEALVNFELPHSLSTPIASLSGGQLTRLALLKLDRENADFLILDEPSNHLDTAGKRWLVNWLQEQKKGSLLISHDRALLRAVDSMWELNSLGITHYGGHYDAYYQQQQLQHKSTQAKLEKAHANTKKIELANKQLHERAAQKSAKGCRDRRTINQSKVLLDIAKERSGKTDSRLKATLQAKLNQAQEYARKVNSQAQTLLPQNFTVASPAITHGRLLTLNNVMLPYISSLQHPISFTISAGQRIAITGPNGSGKSTLLTVIMNQLQPLSGTTSQRRGYFALLDQHCQLLNQSQTVLTNLQTLAPGCDLQVYHTLLAQLRFARHQADEPVSCLSGGERMKLAIAALLSGSKGPDLLVLDEPNNHLDLDTLGILEQALKQFTGALIIASHDDDFIQSLDINQHYSLCPGGLYPTQAVSKSP